MLKKQNIFYGVILSSFMFSNCQTQKNAKSAKSNKDSAAKNTSEKKALSEEIQGLSLQLVSDLKAFGLNDSQAKAITSGGESAVLISGGEGGAIALTDMFSDFSKFTGGVTRALGGAEVALTKLQREKILQEIVKSEYTKVKDQINTIGVDVGGSMIANLSAAGYAGSELLEAVENVVESTVALLKKAEIQGDDLVLGIKGVVAAELDALGKLHADVAAAPEAAAAVLRVQLGIIAEAAIASLDDAGVALSDLPSVAADLSAIIIEEGSKVANIKAQELQDMAAVITEEMVIGLGGVEGISAAQIDESVNGISSKIMVTVEGLDSQVLSSIAAFKDASNKAVVDGKALMQTQLKCLLAKNTWSVSANICLP